jgi:hypothetical protein
MQFFVRGTCTMIDAAVQRDVDGIPKGSHYVSVLPMGRLATLARRVEFAPNRNKSLAEE